MFIRKYQINIGDKFGRLTVTGFERRNVKRGSLLLNVCECKCGKIVKCIASELATGKRKSCGCYKNELTTQRNTTHGQSKTKLYRVWKGMRERCTNPNHQYYHCYGGRGITVCDEWMHGFESFSKWAHFNGYAKGFSIERKDVNGNYCPENCTFIPLKEQALNRGNTISVLYHGKQRSINEISKLTGLTYSGVYGQYRKGFFAEE